MKRNIAKVIPCRYDCIAVDFIELLLNLQKKSVKASLKSCHFKKRLGRKTSLRYGCYNAVAGW
jgi:hypothetical protein